MNTNRTADIIVVALFAAAAIAAFKGLFAEDAREAVEKQQEPQQVDRKASVVSRVDLGEDGAVTVLTVPDPVLPGSPLLDSRCLIYISKELRLADMKCLPRLGSAAD